jgi:hypothetical protein
MAGVIFPNMANALVPLMQMDQQREDRAANLAFRKEESRLRDADRDEMRAMRIQTQLAGMDEKKRKMVTEFATFRANAGGAILAMPPEQQAQGWAMLRQEAQQRGYDLSLFPEQWSPATAARLKFDVDQSIPWADRPQPMSPPGAPSAAPGGAPSGNPGDPTQWRAAIKGNESGGRYDAVGPNTGRGRAYGAYQVMDFNVGPWTAEVLGKPMTPQEFLANPEAQDKVFDAKFGGYVKQYGSPQAAARAWFAGPGGMNNPNAKDVLGTDVAGYERKFTAGLGGPQMAQAGGFSPTNVPAQSVPGALTQMPEQGGGEGQRNVITPPLAAPGAVGNEIDEIRKQTRANGGDIFTVKGQAEIQNGNYVVRSLQNPRQIVGMIPVKSKDAGPSGPFAGNNPDVQAFNYLVSTGRTTVEQAANVLGGKTVTNPADGSIVFMPASALAGAGGPPAQPQAPGAAAPPAGPAGSVQLTPPKKDASLKKLETEIRAVESSIDNFQKIITDAGGGSWRAFINDPTSGDAQKVLGAYNAMKTALRSEAFINTGVLQPAEMKMLDDMLLSPTSVRGYLATPEGYAAMLDQIRTFVKNKMDAAGVAYGQPQPKPAEAAAPTAPPKVGETQDGYLFKGGDPSKPESWEKVR